MGNCIEEVGLTSGLGDGIYLGGEENVCTGNTMRESGRYGMYLTFNTGVGNNTVTSNFIEDCESYGMYVKGKGHIISNNNIVNNVGYGIGVGTEGNGVIISNNHIGTHNVGYINDATNNALLMANVFDESYDILVAPANIHINFTGTTWFNNAGNQILEIASSGSWTYIRGQEDASSEFRIQPGNGNALIDIYGGGDIRITHDSGAGDATRIYEGATNIFTFQNDGTDNLINSTNGIVTIDDCLKLTPVADPPAVPTAGMIYYDSDDNKLKCYNGAGWQDLY